MIYDLFFFTVAVLAEVLINTVVDKRLRLFDAEVSTNVKSSQHLKNEVKTLYGNKCLFCGTNVDITVAHLVSHNNSADYSTFNDLQIYNSSFDARSIRNRIVLCGDKTKRGTCHNLFDHHNITMFYDGFSRTFKAVVIKTDELRPEFTLNHVIELTFPEGFPDDKLPYKRVLAWRIRACALKNADRLDVARLNDLLNMSEFSEAEEIAEGNTSDDEDD